MSTEHPLNAGWDPHVLLKDADLVLVVESDVPWIPKLGVPRADANVAHLGPDPLFARYPLRGFRTDLAITGSVAPTLEALAAMAPGTPEIAARVEAIGVRGAAERQARRRGADATPPALTAAWVSACLNRVIAEACGEDALVVNEYPLVLEEMTIRSTGRYFSLPPSGGLGWGLGAALGAKLAARDKTVVCAVGDGAYMFGNPTAAHFAARAMDLPVLFVVFNNARWAAVHRATLAMYPDGAASRMSEPPFATLEPSPHFEKVAEASGAFGVRVSRPADLLPALRSAMRAVQAEKRQALVNVEIEAAYVKTS